MSELKKNTNLLSASWAKEMFFTRRMNSVPGWIVMGLVGTMLGFSAVYLNPLVPMLIACGMLVLFLVLACFIYPELAYYSYIYSIMVFSLPARFIGIEFPLGILIPITGYLAVLAVMTTQYSKRLNSADFWKTPISLMMLLLFAYAFLEAFNPAINSRAGWWNAFQKNILYLLFYYISFLMLDSIEKIRRFIKYWIILATIIALWGIKQQYFGFTAWEEGWIHRDENTTNLLFQGGMFRKFSLLPDPAAFGILCTSSGLFTLILGVRSPIKKTRNILFLVTFLQLIAGTYSGTRTCNVMLLAGLFTYVLFTINEKKSLLLLISAVFIGLFFLFGPFRKSAVVYRIKTTFEGSKEPSNMVRDYNRKNIQPYIQVHPIGGGLQTSGEEGKKYYPFHPLAGYPPDSGYMKIALEQGWIGLALHLFFYFLILQRGITGFYDARRQEIKTLYIAFTICFFSLAVGQYSQLGISQYPQYLFYLATLVIFYKLKDYDIKKQQEHAPGMA